MDIINTNQPVCEEITPHVIYEDNHILVLFKPASMLAVPDSSGDYSLLEWGKNYIKTACKKPGNVFLAVIHRIDRPVSGLVCFARTSKAASRLSDQLRKRSIRKRYLACVAKRPGQMSGTIETFLKKNQRTNVVSVVNEKTPGAKKAITRWEMVGESRGLFLLCLEPLTGRPHQLRVQLSKVLGCPILGDIKYGSREKIFGGRGLALHSWRLGITHPTRKEPMEFCASLPGYYPFFLFRDMNIED